MFTKRIIPCLDVKNGRVVKGVNFVDLKDAGDPVAIAKAYDEAGADGPFAHAVYHNMRAGDALDNRFHCLHPPFCVPRARRAFTGGGC